MKKVIFLFILILFSCATHKVEEKKTAEQQRSMWQKTKWKKSNCWPLVKAVLENDTIKINEILQEENIDINCKENEYGQTVLHLAVTNYQLQIIPFLLSKGADPNMYDYPSQQSPFINFISTHGELGWSGDIETIKSFLAHGADPNSIVLPQKRLKNYPVPPTPLWLAAEKGLPLTVILVGAGADINLEVFPGQPPIYKALKCKNLDIIKYLLIDKKADYTKVYETGISSKDTLFFMDLFKKYILSDKEMSKKDINNISEYLRKDSLQKSRKVAKIS